MLLGISWNILLAEQTADVAKELLNSDRALEDAVRAEHPLSGPMTW